MLKSFFVPLLAVLLGLLPAKTAWAVGDADADVDDEQDRHTRDRHTDVNLFPIAGGDSDIGFGVGFLGDVARRIPGFDPYRWRAEVGGFISFAGAKEGKSGLQIPYQDYYVDLTVPDLVPGKLRMQIRPSFTQETTQKYFGLGNASSDANYGVNYDTNHPYFEYGRLHPTLAVTLRLSLTKELFFQSMTSFTYNKLDVHPNTSLQHDFDVGSPTVKALLGGHDPHSVTLFEYGFVYDDRDKETVTTHGNFHQLKVRFSPGGPSYQPYGYGQGNLTLRFFTTPIARFLTIATRFVGDIQFGDVPFYELARFDDTFALGGSKGVRGIPAQRYYGKVKIFGNIELRSDWVHFRVSSARFGLGTAVFLDGGRLWADANSHPELDGNGVGLKYGTGAGLRLQEGDTFVIRGDLAYSPDARPIGFYFGAGEMF